MKEKFSSKVVYCELYVNMLSYDPKSVILMMKFGIKTAKIKMIFFLFFYFLNMIDPVLIYDKYNKQRHLNFEINS